MRVTCTNCGGAHAPWDCKRPAKKSTVRKNMPAIDGVSVVERVEIEDSASSAKRPVDTNSLPEPSALSRGKATRSEGSLAVERGNTDNRTPDREKAGVTAGETAPIQKRPRGRPKSITDMAAYKRAKQREYRAKWKGRE